jgi:hypothetical protein
VLYAKPRNTLHYLAIFNTSDPHDPRDFNKIEDALPDGLWQFTTLETLTISGFQHIHSISEEVGQFKALKSLKLKPMRSLTTLPASSWATK